MKKHINILKGLIDSYDDSDNLSKNGTTKKIREENQIRKENTLTTLVTYIEKNREDDLYSLLIEGKSGYEVDEIFQPQFVSRDIRVFLRKLEDL